MIKRKLRLGIVAVLVGCFGVSAQAAVIEFEGASLGTFQTVDYLEDGFRMTIQNGVYDIYPEDAEIGSGNYLGLERADTPAGLVQSTVRIELVSGGFFDFVSLESSSFGGRITFSDGISELFGDFDSEPRLVTFAGHTNLSWIELSSRSNDFLRVDNITLTENASVPEPGTLGLVALALLGWRRRKSI